MKTLPIIAALTLSLIAPVAQADWKVKSITDEMTDEVSTFAIITFDTDKAIASMSLSCSAGKMDLSIYADRYLAASSSVLTYTYRVDKDVAVTTVTDKIINSKSAAHGYSTTYVYGLDQMAEDMKSGEDIKIRLSGYDTTTYRVSLKDYSKSYSEIKKTCAV